MFLVLGKVTLLIRVLGRHSHVSVSFSLLLLYCSLGLDVNCAEHNSQVFNDPYCKHGASWLSVRNMLKLLISIFLSVVTTPTV